MSWHHGLLRSKPILYTLALACLVAFILFSAPTISTPRQKDIQTKTNATALLQAIEGYYTTFSRLPDLKSEELLTEGEEGRHLLRVLLAKDEQGKNLPSNQGIRYLSVEETKDKKKGGLLYQNSGSRSLPEGLYDAWGHPFHLRFSPDDKMEIPDPLQAGEIIRGKRVIVYSYGKDGKPGTKDDIKTW